MKQTHTNMKPPYTMWTKLALMTALSFAAMYGLMYMMVDTSANVYASFNQFYMAAVMTAAMVIIEVVIMSSMYQGGANQNHCHQFKPYLSDSIFYVYEKTSRHFRKGFSQVHDTASRRRHTHVQKSEPSRS